MKHTPFARNIWARSRLLSCLLFACLLFVLEPKAFRLSTRLLVSWNLGTWLYIVIALVTMARATEHSIKRRAAAGDESRFIVLTFACLASVTSLVAILAELGIAKDAAGFSKTFHLFLAGITIVSAWTFIHLIFTQHYAHEYFIERDHDDDPTTPPESLGGLHFPGTQLPDFSDFLYFSYVIGVACQTADVETTSRPMRRVVLIHCILSFFFNTTILALTINLAAGLV